MLKVANRSFSIEESSPARCVSEREKGGDFAPRESRTVGSGTPLVTFVVGNLSSQVQQQIGKDFRRGVPVEAFARTMIQLFCKLGQSLCRKRNLIGVFGNVLPQQTVDLLV